MNYKDFSAADGEARLKISVDGDISIAGFSRILEAISFQYRYFLFRQVSDLTSGGDEYDVIGLNSFGLDPDYSELRRLGIGVALGSWVTASISSPSIEIYADPKSRSRKLQSVPRDKEIVEMRVLRVQYASPGFILISGVASAIKSVFESFSAILNLKDRRLNRRLLEEQYTQLALQNYKEMHELQEKYGVSASEVETLKLVGSVRLFRLLEEAKNNRISSVTISEDASESVFEDA